METLLVTGALPYANSPITVGQLQAIYLPADIYTRFHRLLGKKVLFLCGTDDHGVPITMAADREHETPEEIIQQYREQIQKDFHKFCIEFDCFSRTHQKRHFLVAQEFFRQLYQNGHLTIQETLHLFCPRCEMFLPDWMVEGQCPHEFCEYPLAHGGECEQCGRDVEPKELIFPRCAKCHEHPISRDSQHFYFKLTDFEEPLLNWLGNQDHWDPRIHQQIEDWWKTGFRDIEITRDLNWGVPIPVKEEEVSEKVIYMWFEALLGYITAAKEWAENQNTPEAWQEYWLSPDCQIIHFINKKQVPFHAILWPAVIIAQGENSNWNLPSNIVVHQPLWLKAEKIPTVETSSIPFSNLLEASVFSVDVLRYAFAAKLSKTKKKTLTFREILEYREKLAKGFGNFVHRTLKFIQRHFDGKIPKRGALLTTHQQFLEKINHGLERMRLAYEDIAFAQVIEEFELLNFYANQFFEEEKPFLVIKENRELAGTQLSLAVSALQAMTLAISPILLESAEKIWHFFGGTLAEVPKTWRTASQDCLFVHAVLQNVEPLFLKEDFENPLKKEDLLLDLELRYLMEEKLVGVEQESLLLDSQREQVQLLVGKVVEEEHFKETGKLRCRVDLGAFERWLYLNVEWDSFSLLNRYVIVAVNLEAVDWPMSDNYGKILVREEDGYPVFLESDVGLKPGISLK